MSARISINHAYFHEALSGEFYATTGPDSRKLSVGYLLCEAFELGEVSNPGTHNEFRRHDLGWAPVTVGLHVSHWDIHCLTLAGRERQMDFIHTLSGAGPRTLQVVDNATVVIEEPLGLEYGSGDLAFRVADQAQDFFRTVAVAEIWREGS
ncbi:MAG: hypothetical protein KIH63_000390 [Candidatus Saccharibacteria bacterium]|nr:hypothetical protein [Candidatus Saccharibacteria bacterium]